MFVCPFEKGVMSKALAMPRLFDACIEAPATGPHHPAAMRILVDLAARKR
jgi:hypothetical protein